MAGVRSYAALSRSHPLPVYPPLSLLTQPKKADGHPLRAELCSEFSAFKKAAFLCHCRTVLAH